MAYCTVDDLIIGDLPISDLIDKQTYVDDAAEEIDAIIGGKYLVPALLYVAPVDVDPIPAAPFDWRTYTLLKRINASLSTGRLIAVIAIGSEDASVHAYAKSLIDWAMMMMNQIVAGQIKLVGLATAGGEANPDTAPGVQNRDEISAIEAFEDYFVYPHYGPRYPRWGPIWAPGKVNQVH